MFEQELHGSGLLYSQVIAVPVQKMFDIKLRPIQFDSKENTLAVQVAERNANDQFVVLDSIQDKTDVVVLSTTGTIRLELTVTGPSVAVHISVPKGKPYETDQAEPSDRADQGPLFSFNQEEALAEAAAAKKKEAHKKTA